MELSRIFNLHRKLNISVFSFGPFDQIDKLHTDQGRILDVSISSTAQVQLLFKIAVDMALQTHLLSKEN